MLNKIVVINGSPNAEKGNTEMLLKPFIIGMQNAGAEVETIYLKKYNIKSCNCCRMYCWYSEPGKCCINDDMNLIYPKLREAEVLVLATPVYIPLPGKMQDFINRICPLLIPMLEYHNKRTRIEFRENVHIQKIVLVATGGWWELENLQIVADIAEELADKSSTEFCGAVLRPHAFLMKSKGEFTKKGKSVLAATEKAGSELIRKGFIEKGLLDEISRPLVSEEELRNRYNSFFK